MLGKLKSGEKVTDRQNSHLHKEVSELLEEALLKIDSGQNEFIVYEVDMGRIVGFTSCVETRDDDKIIYAQRPKRNGLTRFVKNRKPEPCSKIVVILKKIEDVNYGYVLITSFIGAMAEVEPWDPKATQKSIEFWNQHALIMDASNEILPGTETNIRPW